jgi:PAS domain S-box-containing protein
MAKRRRSGVAAWLSESATPVFVLDERRVVLFFNHGCESLTGWTLAEVVGRTCDYASSPDPEQVDSLTGALCPPPEVLAGEERHCLIHLTRRDGTAVTRAAHYFPLQFGDGEPLRIVGVLLPAAPPETACVPQATAQLHLRLAAARTALWAAFRTDAIIAESPAMRRVLHQVQLAAESRVAVHLCGEAGTGREFLARTIHYQGPRRLNAFVPIDCASATAFEVKRTLKRLLERSTPDESAAPALQPGAVFLRSVSALPRDVQQFLVEVLDRDPTGGPVRVFSSDAEPLDAAVQGERLLPELFHRLTELVIPVPPLRERREDVPLLGQYLLEQVNRDQDRQVGGFTQEAWDRLRKYNWPGNVRELHAVVSEAHAATKGPLVTAADLPFRFRPGYDAQQAGPPRVVEPIDLERLLANVERREIERALQEGRGNKSRAAELLGLTRPRLYRRMEQLGLADSSSSQSGSVTSEAGPVDPGNPEAQ